MNKPTNLPNLPGVYFFKNTQGEIIYIGKALSLKHRVGSYFAPQPDDFRVLNIMQEYADMDFIVTPTETEAMILEAKLIHEHQPKFNVIFKDGQPFVYLLFSAGPMPSIEIVRNKKRKGTYYGPFIQKGKARAVHNFLMRTFQLNVCNKKIPNGCLDYHLGVCAGTCMTDFNKDDFLLRIYLAEQVLKNDYEAFVQRIDEKIKEFNKALAFERAQQLHEYKTQFEHIVEVIETHFNEKKFEADLFVITQPKPFNDEEYAAVAKELQQLTNAPMPIRTIDCFDISHFQSSQMVGSCIRFTNGKPDKDKFRRFKIKTLDQQNDYAALQEITQRRYRDATDLPDLILIDGGKGQLSAVQQVLPNARCISLAKREETVFGTTTQPEGVKLDLNTGLGKLLIALRDYAHHFAVSYHRLRRKKALPQE